MLHRHGRVQAVHRGATEFVDQLAVGSGGTQEGGGEAQAFGRGDATDGFPNDGSKHDHVALLGRQFLHLGREIRGAALVGGFFGQLHADGFQAIFCAAQHLLPQLIVLVHRADALGPFFRDQLGQRQTDLVVVGGEKRVFELVERLVHFACSGHRKKVDDIFVEEHREGSDVGHRSHVAQQRKNLVLVDQLLRGQHGALGVVSGVFHQQFDPPTVDTALLVDLFNPHEHAIAHLFARA